MTRDQKVHQKLQVWGGPCMRRVGRLRTLSTLHQKHWWVVSCNLDVCLQDCGRRSLLWITWFSSRLVSFWCAYGNPATVSSSAGFAFWHSQKWFLTMQSEQSTVISKEGGVCLHGGLHQESHCGGGDRGRGCHCFTQPYALIFSSSLNAEKQCTRNHAQGLMSPSVLWELSEGQKGNLQAGSVKVPPVIIRLCTCYSWSVVVWRILYISYNGGPLYKDECRL